MNNKQKLDAIIFDMGSTLIEFENSSWEVLNKLCAKNSYEFLKKKNLIEIDYKIWLFLLESGFEKVFKDSDKNLKEIKFEDMMASFFKRLKFEISDGLYSNFLEAYYKPVTEQITLVDGAVDVLRFFKGKKIKIGLVSNTIFPERFHLDELKKFGIFPFLDVFLFSSGVGYKKPHPEIFKLCLKKLNVKPKNSAFLGDRLVEDIGGAQNVGIKAILLAKKGRDYSKPIVPDGKIDNLCQLKSEVLNFFEI